MNDELVYKKDNQCVGIGIPMKDFGQKLFLSLLPIVWGLLNQFWRIKKFVFIPEVLIKPPLFNIILLGVIAIVVYELLWQSFIASQKIKLSFFSCKLPICSIYTVLMAFVTGFITKFFTQGFLRYLATNLYVVPLEEVLGRGIFIKFSKMQVKEFIFWACLSSSAFSLMHWFGDPLFLTHLTLYQSLLKFFDHFIFAFLLSGLAYKSKRIELPVVMHLISNLRFYLYSQGIITLTQNLYMAYAYMVFLILLWIGVKPKEVENNDK